MHLTLKRLSVAIVVLAHVLPGAAGADANREAAVLLFKEANKLRLAKKYKQALTRYRTARKLLRSFKIDYNIALTLEKMKRNAEAARAYEQFLVSGKGKSPPRQIKSAQKKLRRLKKKIATLKVVCGVGGATVKVGGTAMGKTPLAGPVYLEPGKHSVEVEKESHEPFSRELRLRRGKMKTITVKLKVKKSHRPEPVVEPDKPPTGTGKKPEEPGSTAEKAPAEPVKNLPVVEEKPKFPPAPAKSLPRSRRSRSPRPPGRRSRPPTRRPAWPLPVMPRKRPKVLLWRLRMRWMTGAIPCWSRDVEARPSGPTRAWAWAWPAR